MQRFTNILYVFDPAATTPDALRRAVNLARSNGAKLTMVTVSEELPRSLPGIKKAFDKIRDDALQAALSQIDTTDVTPRQLTVVGTPFLEIVKLVLKNGYDLVIKTAEGTSNLSSMLFGTTDLHLFRKCPCPVWIMKAARRRQYARIVAAVDPDPAEASNAELNETILTLSSSLATSEQSELHIVHAWTFPYESTLRGGRVSWPEIEIKRYLANARKQHKEWLDALLSKHEFHDINSKVHLLKGEPGRVIPALAHRKRADLIVMGTVARTGIPGFFIGNTAEKILVEVDCAVLAVKPDSFQSPIEL